jgi:hypothetical protein
MRKGKCENCKFCIKVIDKTEIHCGNTRPVRKIEKEKDRPEWCPKKKVKR